MRIVRTLPALALALGLAAALPADDMAEFQPLMQKAAGVCKELKAHLDAGETKQATAKAAALSTEAKAMQRWWKSKGKTDAAGWAGDIAQMSKQIGAMSKKGDADGALAGFKTMTGNCGSCHNAYRSKDADGKWQIKMSD